MTSFNDQHPFSGIEFAENPEPRCPCMLLLDTSGSMSGQPIAELNQGLSVLRDQLGADSLAVKRVEIAIVTFGPVEVQAEFQAATEFHPPVLAAGGVTPMGEAIEHGLRMLEDRKEQYKQNGIAYFRPWVFLITDGAPTDSWQMAQHMVHQGEQDRAFTFFAIGVEGANMEILKQISSPNRVPLKLRGLHFGELFSWLSSSLGSVSRSNIGDQVPLKNPTAPDGWAEVG